MALTVLVTDCSARDIGCGEDPLTRAKPAELER
jgi:hypothetical protein